MGSCVRVDALTLSPGFIIRFGDSLKCGEWMGDK